MSPPPSTNPAPTSHNHATNPALVELGARLADANVAETIFNTLKSNPTVESLLGRYLFHDDRAGYHNCPGSKGVIICSAVAAHHESKVSAMKARRRNAATQGQNGGRNGQGVNPAGYSRTGHDAVSLGSIEATVASALSRNIDAGHRIQYHSNDQRSVMSDDQLRGTIEVDSLLPTRNRGEELGALGPFTGSLEDYQMNLILLQQQNKKRSQREGESVLGLSAAQTFALNRSAADVATKVASNEATDSRVINPDSVNEGRMATPNDQFQGTNGPEVFHMTRTQENQLRDLAQSLGGTPQSPFHEHAMQDYEMQLMFLKQQNQKRLELMRNQVEEERSGEASSVNPLLNPTTSGSTGTSNGRFGFPQQTNVERRTIFDEELKSTIATLSAIPDTEERKQKLELLFQRYPRAREIWNYQNQLRFLELTNRQRLHMIRMQKEEGAKEREMTLGGTASMKALVDVAAVDAATAGTETRHTLPDHANQHGIETAASVMSDDQLRGTVGMISAIPDKGQRRQQLRALVEVYGPRAMQIQDYELQLMLLEEENERRVKKARMRERGWVLRGDGSTSIDALADVASKAASNETTDAGQASPDLYKTFQAILSIPNPAIREKEFGDFLATYPSTTALQRHQRELIMMEMQNRKRLEMARERGRSKELERTLSDAETASMGVLGDVATALTEPAATAKHTDDDPSTMPPPAPKRRRYGGSAAAANRSRRKRAGANNVPVSEGESSMGVTEGGSSMGKEKEGGTEEVGLSVGKGSEETEMTGE